MIHQVLEYKNILISLNDIIDNSPFKKGYIIKKTGITSPTFYRKLKDLTFTVDEVLKILKVIRPEEVALLELKESLERGRADYKAGRVIDHEDVMQEIRNKIANHS